MFTSNVSLLKHNNIIKLVLPPQKIFGTTTGFTDFSEHVSSPQTTTVLCYHNFTKVTLAIRLTFIQFLGINRKCKISSDHLYAYFQNNIAM